MHNLLCDYQKVYQMLEDEESRDIYLNRLNAMISGDYRYIAHIVTAYQPSLPLRNGKTIQDLIASMPKDRKIVLYGAGTYARENLKNWAGDQRFAGFCSRTKRKQAHGYLGFPVMSPEELLSQQEYSVVINTTDARDEILQVLREGGYPESLIYETGPYTGANDPGQYFAPSFMKYEDEEVFVDAGSCNLATAIKLRNYCGHVKKVYAFEPDPESYRRCLERREETGFWEAEVLPYGTWSSRETLCFHALGTGASKVSEEGAIRIPVMPIDEAVSAEECVTMIKMDVEGSELESLKGARKTIQRDRPKLAICVYHKPEDMTEIPLYVKELVPEYRLYLRHHSNDGRETVLYAVMP